MIRKTHVFSISMLLLLASVPVVFAQSDLGSQLAELASLKDRIKDPDTRTRVDAFHRVWSIAIASDNADAKLMALDLIREPVASASDHIRIPAVYAIVEIANRSTDPKVKRTAIASLREPMIAAQLPIRAAAIDAINSIICSSESSDVALEALQLLGGPVRSGNNGVRIPAINAVIHAVEHASDDRAANAALDMLTAPLDSMAMIGGMEVRLMAVVAVERIGVNAIDVATKAKAMGMMQLYAGKSLWEPEAKKRAAEAAARIQASMNKKPKAPPPSTQST